MLDISPQLRRTLLICALGLLALRLIVALPQEAPRAPEPTIDRSINIGSKNEICLGWNVQC